MSPRLGLRGELELVAQAVAPAPGDRDPQELALVLAGDQGADLVAGRLRQAHEALPALPDRGRGGRGRQGRCVGHRRRHYRPLRARIKRRATATAFAKLLGLAFPLPAMREGRAVVGARAHVRQAEGDVDRLVEVDGLERGQALVVVERDGDVELARELPAEERVRGLASREPGKAAPKRVEDRVDQVALLGPDESSLARVGV